jgi:hypothetical protein
VGLGVGGGVGISVGLGVGISVGLGVGVAVSVGLDEGVGETPESVGLGLGDPGAAGAPDPRRRVVASAARITVPNPLSVAGYATGLRSAEGLGAISGAGLLSLTATGEEWLVALGRWRAPKYTRVNVITRTMRARLAATSVGANIDLIESHRPFPRMASGSSLRADARRAILSIWRRTKVVRNDGKRCSGDAANRLVQYDA